MALRLDVALDRLCLTRSRNEAKSACDSGAVSHNGSPAKPSQTVSPGDLVELRFARRVLEIRLIDLPPKSISKKAARDLYEVVRDEPRSQI